MNGKERALAAIAGRMPDMAPVIPQAHVWALYHYGSSATECMWDGNLYAELQLRAQRDFGWDGIFVATDSCALAHSLGLEVLYTDMGAAPGPEGVLKSLADVESLHMPDPTATRLNEWIKATRQLVRAVGERLLVFARADAGPFSLAAQLRGMEHFLLEIGESRDPDGIHRLLQFCADYALRFARLLLEAGAPIVTIGDALASGSLISPTTYERYVFPYHCYMAREVHKMGGLFSIHICGRNTRAFPLLAQSGADVIEFDALTDFETAWSVARDRVCLLGSVPVSEVLTLGTPVDVERVVCERLTAVLPASRYILSSGCALSANAPTANLHAMVEAGRRYGKYPV